MSTNTIIDKDSGAADAGEDQYRGGGRPAPIENSSVAVPRTRARITIERGEGRRGEGRCPSMIAANRISRKSENEHRHRKMSTGIISRKSENEHSHRKMSNTSNHCKIMKNLDYNVSKMSRLGMAGAKRAGARR